MGDMDEFIDDFRLEANEHLATVEPLLLRLEQGDRESIDPLFRAMHSIKGGASFLDLVAISSLAHQLENLLDAMRSHPGIPIASEAVEVLLQGRDLLEGLINDQHDQESADPAAIIARSQELVDQLLVASRSGSVAGIPSDGAGEEASGDITSSLRLLQTSPSWVGDVASGLPLGEFLVAGGLITEEQLLAAITEQHRRTAPDIELLPQVGLMAEECLRIDRQSRRDGFDHLISAVRLGLLDEERYAQVLRLRAGSRPPLGGILCALRAAEKHEMRQWLQFYFEYRQQDDVPVTPDLVRQFAEHHQAANEADPEPAPAENGQPPEQQTATSHPPPSVQLPEPQDLVADDALLSEYLQLFTDDSRTEFESLILTIEYERGEDLKRALGNLYRHLHSLKGSAGFINATISQYLIHTSENTISLLQRSPDGVDMELRHQLTQALLTTLDQLWNLRHSIQSHSDESYYIDTAKHTITTSLTSLVGLQQAIARAVAASAENENLEELF